MPFINPEIPPRLSRYILNALTTANMAEHADSPAQTPITPTFTSTSSSRSTSASTTTSDPANTAQVPPTRPQPHPLKSTIRRAAEALLLVLEPTDLITDYEWQSVLREVSAYTPKEWDSLPLRSQRSLVTQVLEDCVKMEMLRHTVASWGLEKERLNEVMRRIAEEVNEGIRRKWAEEGRGSVGERGGGGGEDRPDDAEGNEVGQDDG